MTDADKFIGKAIYLVNEIHVSSWSPGDATKGDPVRNRVTIIPNPLDLTAEGKPDAETLLATIIALAELFEGQPVAVVKNRDGTLVAGVLSWYGPEPDDWFKEPVPLDSLPLEAAAVLS